MKKSPQILVLAITVLCSVPAKAQSWGQLKTAAIEADSAKKYDEAVDYWKKALAACPEASGPRFEQSLAGLAQSYQAASKFSEAENYYKQLLALLKNDSLSAESRSALKNYQTLLQESKRDLEAQELESKFSLKSAPLKSPEKSETPKALSWRAVFDKGRKEFQQKSYSVAEGSFKEALAAAVEEKSLEHESETLNQLISLSYAEGKFKEAEPYYQRSLLLSAKFLGQNSKDYAEALNGHALLLRKLNRKDEAIKEEARAEQIMNKLRRYESSGTAAESGSRKSPEATRGGSIYSRARSVQQGFGNPADELLRNPD
ncbi:MAG: tetratricopeptide repeat protein [Candidatus Obscuribacterales bacterium]|nr:tetratricopeptide repeat protein [Candidatus Obscuribacterales bacterium]